MFLEAAVISFLSFWISQEYQRNVYLQAYVSGLLGGGFILIVGGVTLMFSALATILYLRLHRTRRELREVLSAEARDLTASAGYLDTHMEQHLIEMIRKKNQADNLSANANLPNLRREYQERAGQ
jgi:hypothetical protein